MTTNQEEDADVPIQAVEGLNQATRKAMESSDVVFVRNGQLIRRSPSGKIVVLKSVKGRVKVSTRTKKLKS